MSFSCCVSHISYLTTFCLSSSVWGLSGGWGGGVMFNTAGGGGGVESCLARAGWPPPPPLGPATLAPIVDPTCWGGPLCCNVISCGCFDGKGCCCHCGGAGPGLLILCGNPGTFGGKIPCPVKPGPGALIIWGLTPWGWAPAISWELGPPNWICCCWFACWGACAAISFKGCCGKGWAAAPGGKLCRWEGTCCTFIWLGIWLPKATLFNADVWVGGCCCCCSRFSCSRSSSRRRGCSCRFMRAKWKCFNLTVKSYWQHKLA